MCGCEVDLPVRWRPGRNRRRHYQTVKTEGTTNKHRWTQRDPVARFLTIQAWVFLMMCSQPVRRRSCAIRRRRLSLRDLEASTLRHPDDPPALSTYQHPQLRQRRLSDLRFLPFLRVCTLGRRVCLRESGHWWYRTKTARLRWNFLRGPRIRRVLCLDQDQVDSDTISIGRLTVTSVPFPTSLSIWISPWWSWTIR